MNSANRTLAFVLVAACSVGVAVGAHMMYLPSATTTKTDVGTTFYPDFDPTKATYLGVAAFNTTTSKVDEFIVEKRDGQWRIPSHHNYPADAKDRLAKTAASMIGVTRGQLDNTSAASHERLNLLDPLDKKVVGAEGRGSRITIKDGENVLTDLIIGKKEEGPGDRYYVRRPDEDRVYLAQIQPELTTKFTDWIQPNVLDATAANFRQIVLDRYSVDEARGRVVDGEKSVLTRDSSSDEWKLSELPEGKKLKTSVVNQMTTALADMKIVGVRPKTPGIAALIKGDPKARRTAIDLLDMQEKGFYDNGKGGIASNEGDFLAGTSEGILYVLRFGKIVVGDDVDIEIGSSKKLSEEEAQKALEEAKAKDAGAAKDPAKEGQPADEKKDDAKKDEEKDKDEEPKKENRFLFVTVQVDEQLLGKPPVEPVKPTPPPGYKPKEKPAAPATPAIPGFNDPGSKKPETEAPKPAADKAQPEPAKEAEPKKETSALSGASRSLAGPGPDVQVEKKPETPVETPSETKPADEKRADAKPADEKPAETKPAEDKPAGDKPAADQPPAATDAPKTDAPAADAAKPDAPKDPAAEYEAALAKYEQEMDEYKVKKGEYDEKVKKAREREKALSARFADWYYVIPADVFNTINVKPEELVEPEMTPAAGQNPAGTTDESPFPALEGLKPGTPSAEPPAAKPADAPAKDEAAKADAPKADAAAKDAAAPPQPATGETPKEEAAKPEAPKADAPSTETAQPAGDAPAPKTD